MIASEFLLLLATRASCLAMSQSRGMPYFLQDICLAVDLICRVSGLFAFMAAAICNSQASVCSYMLKFRMFLQEEESAVQ